MTHLRTFFPGSIHFFRDIRQKKPENEVWMWHFRPPILDINDIFTVHRSSIAIVSLHWFSDFRCNSTFSSWPIATEINHPWLKMAFNLVIKLIYWMAMKPHHEVRLLFHMSSHLGCDVKWNNQDSECSSIANKRN